MICLTCAELRAVRRGATCPTCRGALLDETLETLEQLVTARLKRKLREWKTAGLLDEHTRARLDAELPQVTSPPREERPVTRRADALSAALPGDLRPAWLDAVEHAFRERDDWQRRPETDAASADAAAGVGGALFSGSSTSALTGGLNALADLDEGDASVGSIVGEYVWWFIGTLLVLAGSVMGVREAWLALGGVPRLLVVAGALLAYHGGFVGLSALVARKSGAAGRVLGGIALALLPVVFAALSALVALSLPAGAAASVAGLAVSAFTLRTLSRRFEGDALALSLAFLPSLAAELPLSIASLPVAVRVSLPLVAVAACGVAARRTGFASLLLALYGAAALAVFTTVGAPGLPALALDFGTFGFVALTGWAAACALAVAPALAGEAARKAHPHAAQAAEVIALAVAAAAGVAAFAGALASTVGADPRADTFSALVPLIGAAAFAAVRVERRHALHPAVVLAVMSSMLVARLQWAAPAGWMLGPAAVAALLFLAARFAPPSGRILLSLWGAAVALAALISARALDVAPMKATYLAAGLIAVAAHGAGARKLWGLHYVGGLAVLFGAEAYVTVPGTFPLVLAAVATAYLLVGRAEIGEGSTRPLDDVSLAAALGAGTLALATTGFTSAPTLLAWETCGAGLFVLAARAVIDKSRALSFFAAVVLGAAITAVTWPRAGLGGAALGLSVLALVRGAVAQNDARPRSVLGLFRLPFRAAGRLLWGDGFAAAALLFGALSVLRTTAFLVAISEPDRPAVVLGAACTLAAVLVAFFTRAFQSFRLRGHFGTWCAAGGVVALAALANRLGRPLPPQVVGFRFTFIVPALWVFAVLVRRFGPRVARWLENEAQGPLYHWVPHAGVAALGALCLFEGVVVGGPNPVGFLMTCPPLLLVAGALAALLLGRSFSAAWLWSVALFVLLVAAAAASSQQALLGPELAQLGGRGPWLRTSPAPAGVLVLERAALGVAFGSLVYAAFAAVLSLPSPRAVLARWVFGTDALTLQPAFPGLLSAWSERAAFAVFAAALLQPRVPAAACIAGAALLLRLAGERKPGGRVALFAFAALHAAVAVATGVVPVWAGPVAAAAGLVVMVVRIVRGTDATHEAALLRAHVAATVLGALGLVWSLAALGTTDPNFATPSVLGAAVLGLWSRWPLTWAVPATLALIASAQLAAARRWTTALARWTFAVAVVDAALALAATAAVLLEPTVHAASDFVWSALVIREGGPLSLALAGGLVAAHLFTRVRDTDTAAGLALGRDVTGALLGVLLALFVGYGDRSSFAFGTSAAALAIVFVISLTEALSRKTGRHAWAAQVCAVAGYALVQAQWRDLEPALDAVFGLGFGFLLVGVTVLARRSNVAPIAKATRAFAALLPVAVALVFPTASTRETAMLAAASSLLYAVLATVEHNRFFGALAAFSANLALLVLALSQGLGGVEIFLAPLGLLLLMLTQLFKKTLPHPARNAVRLIGGLLLYAPAALKLSFQLGDAADATYAVAFGAVCLLGAAAGMLLQIRAYLVMGTLFLTLDVVANLINAGLRDYRVGFVVLSATGLLVLAAMVFATLKRDLVREQVGRLRRHLRGWD